MPASATFRKDVGDIKKALQDKNYSLAFSLANDFIAANEQNLKYSQDELATLKHALVHLESVATISPDNIQLNKIGSILDRALNAA